jgi:hypothetical protein
MKRRRQREIDERIEQPPRPAGNRRKVVRWGSTLPGTISGMVSAVSLPGGYDARWLGVASGKGLCPDYPD